MRALLVLLIACEDAAPPPAPPAPTPASQPASKPAAELKPPTVDSGPRVLALEGKVLIDGQPAYVGMPLTPTSTVETDDTSWARITVMAHGIVQVRSRTKFTLGKSERKEWSVKLALGSIWSLLPKGASYEVTTSNAVAGVRGTTIFVSQQQEGMSGVCACDGEVELQAGKKGRKVKSKHQHIGTLFGGMGNKVKMDPKPKIKPPVHDDKEWDELEKIRAATDK